MRQYVRFFSLFHHCQVGRNRRIYKECMCICESVCGFLLPLGAKPSSFLLRPCDEERLFKPEPTEALNSHHFHSNASWRKKKKRAYLCSDSTASPFGRRPKCWSGTFPSLPFPCANPSIGVSTWQCFSVVTDIKSSLCFSLRLCSPHSFMDVQWCVKCRFSFAPRWCKVSAE